MSRIVCFIAAAIILCSGSVFAQGGFPDVPSEHWAYDAIDSLQAKGILVGYPDGNFHGKRAMSRYELATVIARLLAQLPTAPDLSGFATKEEVDALRASIPAPVSAPPAPDLSNLITKEELAAVGKLLDQLKSELQSLGIDVDQAKRDLAALSARVDAIENELRRVRITGRLDAIGKANFDNTNPIFTRHQFRDIDFRRDNTAAKFRGGDERDINVLRNLDLDINARINDTTSAMATLSIGNYINYLNTGTRDGSNDAFVPYYMLISSDLGFGNLTVGRFPLQLTPYTFMMPDADSYVVMAQTDSGNRPVDGAMLKTELGNTNLTLFAAQHEKVPAYTGFGSVWYGVPFTQSAGARITFAVPDSIALGATYYRGWNRYNYKSTVAPDVLDVMGADLSAPLPLFNKIGLSGSWTKSIQRINGSKIKNADDEAWEAALAAGFDSLKIAGGYRDVGRMFAAPGAWDKIGYVNNPTNVQGWFVSGSFNLNDRIALRGAGEFMRLKKSGTIGADYPVMAEDDEIDKYTAGLAYSFSSNDTMGLSYEYVRLDNTLRPIGFDRARFSYLTWDYDRKLGTNAFMKLGYQLIEFRSGMISRAATDTSYFGSVGWAQLGVSF